MKSKQTFNVLAVLCLLITFNSVKAQNDYLYNPSNSTIQNLVSHSDTNRVIWWKCDSLHKGELFSTYKSSTGLGVDDDMVIHKSWVDPYDCMLHYLYQQYYKDTEVEGAEIRQHIVVSGTDSIVTITTGGVVESLDLSVVPTISEGLALDSALEYTQSDTFAWQDSTLEAGLDSFPLANGDTTYYPKGELVLALTGDLTLVPENYKLCWRFTIVSTKPNYKIDVVYVNAATGSVEKWRNGSDAATFNHIFYGAKSDLDTKSHNGNFYTITDGSPSGGSGTRNIRTTEKDNLSTWWIVNMAKSSSDSWVNWKWGQTAAHWGVQNAWDMFDVDFGHRGMDGNGGQVRVEANGTYGESNGYFDRGNNRLRFYGNSSSDYAGGSIDAAGHEYGHGVIFNLSELDNAKEPGAINESMADIFGLLLERRVFPTSFDWFSGLDHNPQARNMQKPSLTIGPFNQYGPNWYKSHTNWRNVDGCNPNRTNGSCYKHVNAGVCNRWFYLLSMGGVQSPNGTAISVSGIGIDKASKIMWHSLNNFIGKNESFKDMRMHTITSAIVLYGYCSTEHLETCLAWSACNVGESCPPCDETSTDFTSWCHRCELPSAMPLSIDNQPNSMSGIIVYPNPANDVLNINLGEFTYGQRQLLGVKIELIDMHGRVIQLVKYDYESHTASVDISHFSPGVYLVRVSGEGYSSSERFVVSK